MDNFRGSILMVAAMLFFAIEDMFIKLIADALHVGQILMILGAGGGLVFALIARRYGDVLWSRDLLNPMVMVRNAGEVIGTFGFVSAVALTPISSASTILQATPLVVTIGAALFLGETVGWRRWAAVGIGLCGVILVLRPGLDGFDINSLFAVQGVIGLAIRDLATRRVPEGVTSRQISTYAFLILVPVGAVVMYVSPTPYVMPGTPDLIRLVCAVIVGAVAYYMLVAATRIGQASLLAPFRYTRLVFALTIAIIVFDETIDALTLLGAAIIVTSGIYTLWREARQRRTSLASQPAL